MSSAAVAFGALRINIRLYFSVLTHDDRTNILYIISIIIFRVECEFTSNIISSCRTATLDFFFSIWLNQKSQCFCALS